MDSKFDKKKDIKKIMIPLILILLTIIVGTSLALWQIVLKQTDENTITTSCFKVEYANETDAINLNDAVPMTDDEGKKLVPYSFTLTNTCNTKADYVINLETLSQGENILADSYVKANLVKETDEVFLNRLTTEHENLEKVIKDSNSAYMLDQGTLEGKESTTYNLRLWIDSDASNIEEMMDRVFASKITVTTTYVPKDVENDQMLYVKMRNQAVLDNTKSEFVSSSTGIDFGVAPSDTNGKGVYTIADTKDNKYPVHYFRGAVTNNNVKFANFCWKIVRTTETGGIKLIYNGVPDEAGRCTNTTGTATQIGTSSFNLSYNSVDYVGYMYPESTNENSSTIKTAIDTWYQNNMTAYTNYLEDTVWCNDRSVYKMEGLNIEYGAYGRNIRLVKPKPSIICPNNNDSFTVNSANGNGKLTYPVALLTADEMTLAGHGNSGNSINSYLCTNELWWLMSPSYFLRGTAAGFYVYSNGNLYINPIYSKIGVRPSISLAKGTMVSESSDGSPTNPYVVILN